MMQTLSLRRVPRGLFWRWERMLSSLARVLLRNSSLLDMVGEGKDGLAGVCVASWAWPVTGNVGVVGDRARLPRARDLPTTRSKRAASTRLQPPDSEPLPPPLSALASPAACAFSGAGYACCVSHLSLLHLSSSPFPPLIAALDIPTQRVFLVAFSYEL